MEISTVGSYVAKWGEGPVWWEGGLYYVDIENHKVIRWVAGEEEKMWDVGERVGLVIPEEDGTLIIAGDNGFRRLDPATGQVTSIADPESEKPNNRFNDGKRAPDGRIFAGTISLVKDEGAASLYCLEKDGSVRKVFGDVTNSNGLAWSADARTVYYIDTPRREIWAFDYEQSTGEWSHRRTVVKTEHIDASPDGMCINAAGQLWVAFCHGGCLVCFDPQSGAEIARVDLPCIETTSCCFGANESELYVTTGIHKSLQEELAGRLFCIRFSNH